MGKWERGREGETKLYITITFKGLKMHVHIYIVCLQGECLYIVLLKCIYILLHLPIIYLF